jgi:hypothetical protein
MLCFGLNYSSAGCELGPWRISIKLQAGTFTYLEYPFAVGLHAKVFEAKWTSCDPEDCRSEGGECPSFRGTFCAMAEVK